MTITGTDLGTSFGDIVSITVGSLTCTPIVTSYLVGRSITCNISSGSQTQLGVANVLWSQLAEWVELIKMLPALSSGLDSRECTL